ncbi:Flp pilus assembly protein CpaB [Paenibacillus pasadenensis]|uniref:Flp pilus assembly protein CpaB n=1 Tax=Paenibacillus pasadenensis TaxID=217090 RepID=UPI00040FB39C|nr:RcpC/CpaB family pilus assembly protein [Paenibacillus pasadenensis]
MADRKRIALGLSLVVVAGAIGYIGFGGEKDEVKKIPVYVASRTITQGEEVQTGLYKKEFVPEAESWMITNLEEIKGKKAVRTIQAGRVLDDTDFSDEKDAVAFTGAEGEYSIRVKAENVNGGRVQPGNVVNVLFVPFPRGSLGPDEVPVTDGDGITRVEGVVVLSVRTQYAKDVNDGKEQDLNNVPAAVTLKVTPEQAGKLAWQQEHGTLSIFVRGGDATQ